MEANKFTLIEVELGINSKDIASSIDVKLSNIYKSYRREDKMKFFETIARGTMINKLMNNYDVDIEDILVLLEALKHIKGKRDD